MTTDSTLAASDANAGPPWEVVEPAATEQAAGAAPSTDLAVFDSIEKTITEIEARHKNVVYDLTTTKGNEAARKARAELVDARTSADKTYTAWNQPILAKQEKARERRDGFKERVKALEDPLDKLIKADELRRATEKKARDDAEAARVKGIRDRIASIYAQPAACAGQPSAEIELSIAGVEVLMTDKAFYQELQDEAEAAAEVVLTKLRSMMSAAKASEDLAKEQKAEADRLAEQRAQLERDRAELERQQEAARQALADAEAARQADAVAAAAKEAAARAEREAADRQKEADLAEKLRLAQVEADALTRQATERLAEQRRLLDEQRTKFESEQAAARAAKDAEAFGATVGVDSPPVAEVKNVEMRVQIDAMSTAPAVRVETVSESGATIVTFEKPKLPVTVQTDAFEAERLAEAARAAAAPKPSVKRPDDERLTAAVAKAFEVEPTVAAEWLGTYDALEEIGRLQGAPA